MTDKSLDKSIARAVQDAVVERRGGEPPSYNFCLNEVRKALKLPAAGEKKDERIARITREIAARIT